MKQALYISAILLFAFCAAVAACGCRSPAILGGPTASTTTHVCWDGYRCPNGYECPAWANLRGRCVAPLNGDLAPEPGQ
jgi:hypothetical protein